MPELPEVETVRRLMRRELQNQKIVGVQMDADDIVHSGYPPEAFVAGLVGATVLEVGRKGKYWWLELDRKPWLYGHLGMTGWIHRLTAGEPIPRFCKIVIESEHGGLIAMTDGRRLGRLWLGGSPESEPRLQKLGFDSFDELPSTQALFETFRTRKAPIKALLLDQALFAGVGNYVADEAMYQARIAPQRLANSLDVEEVERLRGALTEILTSAIEADADETRFPKDWLFHHRWGGKRGSESIAGHAIVRETIGGRTTAWVPDLQR